MLLYIILSLALSKPKKDSRLSKLPRIKSKILLMYRLRLICSIWTLIWALIDVNTPPMVPVYCLLLRWDIHLSLIGEINHPFFRLIFAKILPIANFYTIRKCLLLLKTQALISMITEEYSFISLIRV